MSLEVRSARVEDLGEVVRLERACATAPHWSEGVYRGMLAPGSGVSRCLYVALRGDEMVGFAVGRVAGDEGEIESIAVVEAARRRGAGKALLAAVLAWCRGAGVAAIDLEVRAGGEAAQRLYASFGFVATGRRRSYYSDPEEDAVLMRWELNAECGPAEVHGSHV